MARGGYGGDGLPLHARTRVGPGQLRTPGPGAPVPEGPALEPPACPVKHCWVTGPVDAGGPRPGLLLEWRRLQDGRWEGRVVYAALLRPGTWVSVEEWLPAELLVSP